MIHTLTGNILAERTLQFSTWQIGKTQRARTETFQVGGKGINVSKMLTRLGAPNLALCFPGGATGDECLRWLDIQGLAHHAFRTTTPTRTGTVVRAPGQPETTFLGADAPADHKAIAACAAWLDAQPLAKTHLAFCGSFPGWDTPRTDPIRAALERRFAHADADDRDAQAGLTRHGNGAPIYVDTYGPPLTYLVQKNVELIKINRAEFDQLCASIKTVTRAPLAPLTPLITNLTRALAPDQPMHVRLAAACRQWPAHHWVITDGPRPIWYATRGTPRPPASIRPQAIREVSATGSGDVLFASLLDALINQNLSLDSALAYAIPYATANAASANIAEPATTKT